MGVKRYNLNGHLVDMVTLSYIAKRANRTSATLRKMEQRGILPTANFRGPAIPFVRGEKAGESRNGDRLYSRQLADKVADIIAAEIRRGVNVTEETKLKILYLFNEEKNRYA